MTCTEVEIQYLFNILDLYTLYWIHVHISLNVICLSHDGARHPHSLHLANSSSQHEIQGVAPTEREP